MYIIILNIHIIEIISQSVLLFIQNFFFTIIKIIYLIIVNSNKVLHLAGINLRGSGSSSCLLGESQQFFLQSWNKLLVFVPTQIELN